MKNILFFLLIILFCYPLMIVISGLFVPQLFTPNLCYELGAYGNLYSRLEEVKKKNDGIDILFLGSSHAYRGFDNRNFSSVKTFNLGSSAQTPQNTMVLLSRYLDKLNPKIVIYEVYPGSFASDGIESSLDLISNDRNDWYSTVMVFSTMNIKVINTFIYSCYRDLFSLNNGFKETNKGVDSYVSGGFVESKMRYYKFVNMTTHKWSFSSVQMKAFEKNLEMLKARNAKVILVFAPITTRLYNSYSNNDYVDSLFNSLNLKYFNFNKLIQMNDSLDFYDAHHLNQNGVNTFNKELIKRMPNYFNK